MESQDVDVKPNVDRTSGSNTGASTSAMSANSGQTRPDEIDSDEMDEDYIFLHATKDEDQSDVEGNEDCAGQVTIKPEMESPVPPDRSNAEETGQIEVQEGLDSVRSNVCAPRNEPEPVVSEESLVTADRMDNSTHTQAGQRNLRPKLTPCTVSVQRLTTSELMAKGRRSSVEKRQLRGRNNRKKRMYIESDEEKNTEKQKFKCKVCGKVLNCRQNLTTHSKIHSGSRPFKCRLCKRTFVLKPNLILHIMSHEKPRRCKVCWKSFPNFGELISHQKRLRDETKHKAYEKRQRLMLEAHKSASKDNSPNLSKNQNQSPITDKIIPAKMTSQQRQRIISEMRPCHVPLKRMSVQIKLVNGAETFEVVDKDQNQHPEVACTNAAKITDSNVIKLKKLERISGRPNRGAKKPQLEPKGNSTAGNKSVVAINHRLASNFTQKQRHKKVRTAEFECQKCRKAYSTRAHLNRHLKIHAGKKPFKCKVCEKKFQRSDALQVHSRLHTGVQIRMPYKCRVCQKKFAYPSGLAAHVVVHTGEKQFECAVCRKRFTKECALKNHSRIHSGEKPYKCEVCEMAFNQKCGLTKHIACVHTTKKPHQCRVCKKQFARTDSLFSHSRVHKSLFRIR